MARKNCPVCGGVLRTRTDGGCTKCENRRWYRRLWRRCRKSWANATSVLGTYWPLLIVAALLLAILFVGWQEGQREPLQTRVTQLEETVARQAEQIAKQEAENQELREQVADLEQAVVENTAAREELQRLLEELLCQVEPSKTEITVEQGDTVWDLLTQELGRYPTWEEIQKVVDANGLENFMDGQGLWIVLVYPGQVLDLSPALGG